jgi:diguanylate cyclase (GGDEF)-like protein
MVPQPLSELEQNAKALSRATFRTAIVALLIAGVLSWWLAGRLVQPLHNVVAAARQSTGGHDPVPARPPGLVPREFHELTSNFNAMVDEVQSSRAALEASGRRLWDFADGAADWFWESDAGMRLRFLSDRFAVVTGMAAERSLGRDMSALIHENLMYPDEWALVSAQLQRHEAFTGVRLVWPMSGPRSMQIYRISGKPVLDANGVFQGYRGTGRDVTDEERLARQLAHQAAHDDLTGLRNRREFETRLAQAIESARAGKTVHVLCYLDLDQFKVVNDSAGHAAGDALLRSLAAMLRKRVRGRDTLARLGGDEFGLLLEHCGMAQAQQIVGTLVRAIQSFSFEWEGRGFTVGASAGLVNIDDGIADVSGALRRADAACYAAKAQGGGRISMHAT